MNILISGVTSSLNRGVDALVRTNIMLVRRSFPNSSIYIMSIDPRDKTAWQELGVTVIILPKLPFLIRLIRKLRIGHEKMINKYFVNFLKETLPNKMDIHVVTGGDIFSSDYGSFNTWSDIITSMDIAYKPITYLSAHSIGRFTCQEHIAAFSRLLNLIKLISVRESATHSYLIDNFSKQIEEAHITIAKSPDPAFLLGCKETQLTQQFNEKVDILRKHSLNGKIIIYAVSNGIAKFKSLSAEQIYQERVKFVQSIVNQGYGVILLAHVQGKSTETNDVAICKRLEKDLCLHAEKILCITKGDSEELKTLIKSGNVLCAERMHAAIAGLSLRIPTIVIAYSVKAEGILKDLFLEEATYQKVYRPLTGQIFSRLSSEVKSEEIWSTPVVDESILKKYKSQIYNGYESLQNGKYNS